MTIEIYVGKVGVVLYLFNTCLCVHYPAIAIPFLLWKRNLIKQDGPRIGDDDGRWRRKRLKMSRVKFLDSIKMDSRTFFPSLSRAESFLYNSVPGEESQHDEKSQHFS